MANYGIKSSQDGYDVKTAADRFLVFSSAFNCLKVFDDEDFSATLADGASTTFTHNHGLSYTPSYVVFARIYKFDGSWYWVLLSAYQPEIDPDGNSISDRSFSYAYPDGADIKTHIENDSGSSQTYYVKSIIFVDKNE